MKQIFALLLGLCLLAGCAGGNGPSLPEALTLANEAIATSNNAARVALEQGHIDIEQACQVSEYSKVARVAVDQGWTQWVLGNPEEAWEHLRAAQAALAGLAAEAAARIAESCQKGGPSS